MIVSVYHLYLIDLSITAKVDDEFWWFSIFTKPVDVSWFILIVMIGQKILNFEFFTQNISTNNRYIFAFWRLKSWNEMLIFLYNMTFDIEILESRTLAIVCAALKLDKSAQSWTIFEAL